MLFHVKKNTKCKFIVAGDWQQLPPVMDRHTFDYENSTLIHTLCDGKQTGADRMQTSRQRTFRHMQKSRRSRYHKIWESGISSYVVFS